MKRKICWNRKLDCGHSRATDIAYMCKDYTKPKIGDTAYCRTCFKQRKITNVEEIKEYEK